MQRKSKNTVGRAGAASPGSSRIRGLARILGAILSLALLPNPAQAITPPPPPPSVTLAWDLSTDPDVVGYRVYYGAAAGVYTNSVVSGNVTTSTIPGLVAGTTYFFAITAIGANGVESVYSGEISYTVPSGLPTVKFRAGSGTQVILTVAGLVGHTYEIQATADLQSWTVIGTATLGAGGSLDFTDTNAANFPTRYYRTHDTLP